MSLRAIKKRENQLPPPGVNNTNSRTTLFKKLTNNKNTKVGAAALQHQQQQQQQSTSCNSFIASDGGARGGNGGGFIQSTNCKQFNLSVNHIKQQYQLLGRQTKSNPEFGKPSETLKRLEAARLVRTKSEGDVNKLLSSINQTKQGALLNAKSEVCLKTISTHNYQLPVNTSSNNNNNNTLTQSLITPRKLTQTAQKTMLTGARSHRDLTQSAYASSSASAHNIEVSNCGMSTTRRRMSEGNYVRSQRTNSMSTSEMTTSSNAASSTLGHSVPPVDPNSILRIPIIGYEVMEERARFTVYKLRVENPHTNDCWLVLRRYTDFVRLNTKLKQAFPHLVLNLPRKKIFGDNFNAVFLDNRIQGLQMFVNSIMSKEELRKCQLVREFFCLDEPPSYSESMEECRAIFEAQEETIAHLKLQVNTKNDLILQLQQKLREEIQEKEQLKEMLKNLNINPTNGNI